jgi:hypothetical protein
MSKKKNTLKDLDEFLKQQAATLVSPSRLREQPEAPKPVETPKADTVKTHNASADNAVTASGIAEDLKELSVIKGEAFTAELCSIILSVMNERTEYSPEEKMLINTALYLKHGSNWKDEIRKYWKNKKS